MERESISRVLAFIFFIGILTIDWLYVLSIQADAPIISHWVIALPMIIPLFFAMTLLALIGMYINNVWGYILAYCTIILSMYFSSISYHSLPPLPIYNDLQFIVLIILNVLIFFYLACFQMYLSKN